LVGVGAVVMAFLVGLMALLGDLLATNRRLTEEVLYRVRRLDTQLAASVAAGRIGGTEGVETTGTPAWSATTSRSEHAAP
jgi:hypothetical protein